MTNGEYIRGLSDKQLIQEMNDSCYREKYLRDLWKEVKRRFIERKEEKNDEIQ